MTRDISRRDYLKTSALLAAPLIVPSRFFGKDAPSNTINVAQIGWGRIGTGHDLPEVLKHDDVRLVAAADVDLARVNQAPGWIREFYARPNVKRPATIPDVKVYQDYRVMLAEHPEIDAVIVSTPDHAHMLPVLHAAVMKKAIYMQKPHSLTIEEGRLMSNVLQRMGTTFSVGSQQRSTDPWPQFKQAVEAVRNGRVGNLKTVYVGLPGDPPGGDPTPQPVPPTFDYDHWLSTTPVVPYTEDRVHPQKGFGRGGWLRCEQFSAGMITGWGAHHMDIAHWGMATEYTGPIQLEGTAKFATGGLWNVHGDFRVEAKYANGVTVIVSGAFPNGIRFEGDEGWIFVSRGDGAVTASDPTMGVPPNAPIAASKPSLLSPLPPDALRLYGEEKTEHHTDWIRAVRRQSVTTATPVEVSHRSTSACLLAHIAMKLQRPLRWDPINERFDDAAANAMLARPQREKYRPGLVPGLRA